MNNGRKKGQQQALDEAREQRKQSATEGTQETGIAGQSDEEGETSERSHDGREGKENTTERQGNLGENRTEVNVSDTEFDEDGSPFVLSSKGNTVFGEIREETNLTPAPIKLSLGNSKYGRVHLEKRHGEQIRNAGFNSVEEFVEFVATNYKRIRVGENSAGEPNGTYLLQLEDDHNNTLYIELSTDNSYWSVNSGGVFRRNYGNNKEEVWSASEEQNKQSATDNTLQATDKSDNPATSNGNVSNTSVSKVTNNSTISQEKEQKNASETIKNAVQERIDEETGNVALFHKASEEASEVSEQEGALRDALVETMRNAGIEVVADEQEGQRVLDIVNGENATLSKAQKRAAETVSVASNEEHRQTVVSTADGAKVLNNLDELAKDYDNLTTNNRKSFLNDVAEALGAKKHGSNSQYATFETKSVQTVIFVLSCVRAKIIMLEQSIACMVTMAQTKV